MWEKNLRVTHVMPYKSEEGSKVVLNITETKQKGGQTKMETHKVIQRHANQYKAAQTSLRCLKRFVKV